MDKQMGSRYINSKNEYVTGRETFSGIKKKKSNFDIFGSDQGDHVTLASLRKVSGEAKKNPHLHYYGYDGIDSLIYDGPDIAAIDLKVVDKDTVTVVGGYGTEYTNSFSSLTVTAHNIEIFNFTGQNDIADFSGLSYGVTAYGEGGDDTLKGTQHNDTLYGGKGNDTLFGYGGDDHIEGGDGVDTIYGGSGADLLKGGKGNDTIWGGSSGNTAESANKMHGGEGNDIIHGAAFYDTLYGPTDNIDIAYGGSGHDTIYGYDGDDILDGGTGADTIYGGTGNDIISSGSMKDQTVSDQLWGGSGADMFIIGDGSTDYTSDFVLDISAAFSDKGNSWTSILDTAGLLVSGFGGYSKLAWLGGNTVRAVASGFDTFYKMTGSRKTTFTIDADWGTTSEAVVNDFNPLEDHILIRWGIPRKVLVKTTSSHGSRVTITHSHCGTIATT
ncbi:calcium-binding protein [Pseudovibrio denitrificans]|uniref:calcium-binding protein n=1 Tax=Pseudovibrio denitrificans TaxID=258256 RepID=UPI0013E39713|nr:calcium-binding protein [Pseudovibrio denitrificans]